MIDKRPVLLLAVGVAIFQTAILAGQMPIRLQALQLTSGENAEKILDGKTDTGWQPQGDPRLEGVLFRFEKPTSVSHVEITPCAKSSEYTLTPFINSVRGRLYHVKARTKIVLSKKKDLSLRSLFLRFSRAKPGSCIAEVSFFHDGQKLQLMPPRKVRASIETNSTLKPEAAYHKSYLFDQSTDYGWVEGVAGLGKGERISIVFERPCEITGIEIYNGYQRSEDHFKKNARVARLKISADGSKPSLVDVPDKMGPSLLKWSSKGKVKKLTLEIAAAKPGKKYRDLVISELRFRDKDGFFTVTSDDGKGLVSGLKKELEGKALGALLDRSLESYCRLFSASVEMSEDAKLSDFGLRKLKLRSNYRFVYYSQIAVGDEANIVSESIEGIWVPSSKRTKGPWTEIKLYGRSQHIGQDIDESYEVITKNTKTRIIGGSLRVASVEALGRKVFFQLMRKWDKSPAYFKVQCGKNRMSYFSNSVVKKKTRENDEVFSGLYDDLVKRKAVVVQGRAITDLFF